MEKLYKKAFKIIDSMEADEVNLERFHKAAEYFCTVGEMCEAYKNALSACLEEQYHHFIDDQEAEHWVELVKILTATEG